MGVPARRGRNELDCRLRDELDDVGLLRQRLRPPLWQGDISDGGAYLSARTSRFCGDADLLAHAVLDVPLQGFFEDLTDHARHAFRLSRQKARPSAGTRRACAIPPVTCGAATEADEPRDRVFVPEWQEHHCILSAVCCRRHALSKSLQTKMVEAAGVELLHVQ